MPLLFIHATNADFRSRDDGTEYDGPEAALAIGVQSAVLMAADEIAQGRPSSAIEVSIEREDGSSILRSVVSISVSPLLAGGGEVVPFPSSR